MHEPAHVAGREQKNYVVFFQCFENRKRLSGGGKCCYRHMRMFYTCDDLIVSELCMGGGALDRRRVDVHVSDFGKY